MGGESLQFQTASSLVFRRLTFDCFNCLNSDVLLENSSPISPAGTLVCLSYCLSSCPVSCYIFHMSDRATIIHLHIEEELLLFVHHLFCVRCCCCYCSLAKRKSNCHLLSFVHFLWQRNNYFQTDERMRKRFTG